jgi:hypothetical protein
MEFPHINEHLDAKRGRFKMATVGKLMGDIREKSSTAMKFQRDRVSCLSFVLSNHHYVFFPEFFNIENVLAKSEQSLSMMSSN